MQKYTDFLQEFHYNGGSIYQANNEEFIRQTPSESLDGTFIDPPYTNGETDVLAGHKIQTKVNIQHITNEIYRTQKKDTFYAVFGQMPTILAWHEAAIKAGFKFRIDITWAKKKGGMAGNLLMKKSHELIWIYSKGNPNYYKTKGVYSDVSQALVENNLMDIESVFRHLSYWKGIAQGKVLVGKRTHKNRKGNTDYFIDKGGFNNSDKEFLNLGHETKAFNTVWAYSSHNNKFRNETEGVKHPSVKSIPCLERLIELITPDLLPCGSVPLIADWYIGSGTSALAAMRTKRRFIGTELFDSPQEIDGQPYDGYFTISKKRIITEDKRILQSEAQQNIF